MKRTLSRQLAELEQFRHTYGKGSAKHVEQALLKLRDITFADAESLIHFHDALLFLRAFPQSPRAAKLAQQLLSGVGRHVAELHKKKVDFEVFDDEEFSGIANTTLHDTPTYELARWMVERFPEQVRPDWDVDAVARQLSSSLPGFVPLLADDCLVEPDTPYLEWLSDAAGGSERILPWLLQRIESSSLPLLLKTAYYDALAIDLEWELGEGHASRTHNLRQPANLFVHREPLITRKQVSLDDELSLSDLVVRRLDRKEGEAALNLAREVLTVRYRELHGSTRADAGDVYEVEAGRGVQLFIWGVPPQWRLPLRAYHAGFTLKNGVPVNYFEAISLAEWVEVGFNTFYAFREGETAWIYSKILHLLHQLTGVTCFSAYPYQLGHENEEAIKSGAFWFYRKLGFRPGRPELLALAEKEEAKISSKPGYRSSAATLRKLAAHHAFYEFGSRPRGVWDTFSDRNVGFKVQKQMAAKFESDPERMRRETVAKLVDILSLPPNTLSPTERAAFENLAPVLNLIDDLPNWSDSDRQAVGDVIRAKGGAEEIAYLRKMQAHAKLRDALVRLGSSVVSATTTAASAD